MKKNKFNEEKQSDKRQKDSKIIETMVVASDNTEALEEMLKYWEEKGYEKASPRYADHSDSLRLFYWQRILKRQ